MPDFKLFGKLNSTDQYYLAQHYNWDDGIEVLKWIIESRKCDKGTASLIFWASEPDWYFENWGQFAHSFKKSADLVYAEYARTRHDAYWLPAIYLYRQWIELSLKRLWSEIEGQDESFSKPPRVHSLVGLWLPLREWLVRNGIFSDVDRFVSSAERILSDLDAVDPNGTAFRYPQSSVPHPDVQNFSLDDFESALDQIDTLFFGVVAILDQNAQYQSETKRD